MQPVQLINPELRKASLVILATILAATLVFATIPGALAAKPNNQACLGIDFSGYARGGIPDFGQFIADNIAPGGAGSEAQAHLAGQVDDGVIPNSCND